MPPPTPRSTTGKQTLSISAPASTISPTGGSIRSHCASLAFAFDPYEYSVSLLLFDNALKYIPEPKKSKDSKRGNPDEEGTICHVSRFVLITYRISCNLPGLFFPVDIAPKQYFVQCACC